MSYRLITCPETAHLEMIEDEPHPLGLLILACSRFRPSCAVACPRTCAARLDRRDRQDDFPTLDDARDLVEQLAPACTDDLETRVELSRAAATSRRARLRAR
jgi:hypothetical protein